MIPLPEIAAAVQIISGGIGIIKGLRGSDKDDPHVSQEVMTGDPLSNYDSKTVFGLTERYKKGKENYDEYLKQDKTGSVNKVVNADSSEKVARGLEKLYSNSRNTNISSFLNAKKTTDAAHNEGLHKGIMQEQKNKLDSYKLLRGGKFNEIRAEEAFRRSLEVKTKYLESLKESFRYNLEDIQRKHRKGSHK